MTVPAAALQGTDFRTTRIGFGCAGLLQVPSARKRQAVLDAAYDAGVRHFDVARMYGMGAAERELGRFVRRHPEGTVIATKYGIGPRGGSTPLQRLQGPARALLRRYPGLRRKVKGQSQAFHTPRHFDGAFLRKSLHVSLSELGVDHVDILFLHEPLSALDVPVDEVLAVMAELRQAGTIGAWGVAGEIDPCAGIADALGPTALLQVRDDVFTRADRSLEADRGTVTFGILQAALPHLARHLRSSPEVRARWSRLLELDLSDTSEIAPVLLADAMLANPRGVVLFSTTSPARAAKLPVSAVARLDSEAPAALRNLVSEHL